MLHHCLRRYQPPLQLQVRVRPSNAAEKAAAPGHCLIIDCSTFAMRFVTFCAFAATLAALVISAPLPSLSDADLPLL